MKRHVALVALVVTVVVVIDLHVDWRRADNGVLMRVGEQDVDVWGQMREAWTVLSRRCGRVQTLRAGDPVWERTQATIRDYSPPDSHSAQVVDLLRQDDWLLAQVVSDRLMTAVAALKMDGSDITLVPRGVWSGNTAPWVAGPWVRDYLRRQVPTLPHTLTDCLEIAPESPLQSASPRPKKDTP